MTAVVQATVDFKGQSCELHSVEASTRASRLSARGRLSANSDLKLDATTMDFSELAPMVTSWRGSRAQELPIEFGGSAKFQGTVLGRLERPALAGHLELHDFTTVLRRQEKPVAGAAPAERVVRTRWELLEGDVEYSSTHESLRNGVLRRGGAKIGAGCQRGAGERKLRCDPAFFGAREDGERRGQRAARVGGIELSGDRAGERGRAGGRHGESPERQRADCHEGWNRMAAGGAFGDGRRELHGEPGTVAQHRGEKRPDAVERRCAHQRADQRVWLRPEGHRGED